MSETLTSSAGSSPSDVESAWRPLGRRATPQGAALKEHRFGNESKQAAAFNLGSSGSSALSESGSGEEESFVEGNNEYEARKQSELQPSVRPSIIDVDPVYAASCLPVLTSLNTSSQASFTEPTTPLFHVKSPVLSSRKDSQTWQLQEKELLTSPRFNSSPNGRRSPVNIYSSLSVPGNNQTEDEYDTGFSETSFRTKDLRAASVDFSFHSKMDVTPPLPPSSEEINQRSRAKSFSYSCSYGAVAGNYPWNNNGFGYKPMSMRPPPPQDFNMSMNHMHHRAPPLQPNGIPRNGGNHEVESLAHGVRKLSIDIPNPSQPPSYPPAQHYSQYPPHPQYRRYSGDAYFMPSFPEKTEPPRNMRSYSMECASYGNQRQEVPPMYHSAPLPEPPTMMPPHSAPPASYDWSPRDMESKPSPPLPPDMRTSNCSIIAPFPFTTGPVAYYEIEFKRGRKELFSGKDSYNVGDFVKVEADRGEDIGRVMQKSSDLSNLETSVITHEDPQVSDDSHMATTSKRNDLSVKRVLCLASQKECEMLNDQRREESEVFEVCKSKVRQRLLPMTVIDAEYQFDRHKLTFFFEAERRIDFRELVRDLFAIYKTRIWLQQVIPNGGRRPSNDNFEAH
jgi:hypothetical protein